MGTLYVRHVGALLRKNLILRKRAFGSSVIQLLLPSSMILILLWIKIALQDTDTFQPTTVEAVYPTANDAITPFSFLDYVNAILAPKKCIPKPSSLIDEPDLRSVPFVISGINIVDWPVPFVKCNARECTEDDVAKGRDVSNKYCSHFILALAPTIEGATDRAKAFQSYIYKTYPQIIQNTTFTQKRYSTPPYGKYDMVQIFNSSSDLVDYVKHKQYGDSTIGRPKVALGVEIGGDDDTTFEYSIRTNATNWNSPELFGRPVMITQPSTKTEFNAFTKTADSACELEGGSVRIGGSRESHCTSQYMYNGAITIQRLVDDFIIDNSGVGEDEDGVKLKVAENGVSFVDFPSKEYVQDGFYAIVAPYVPLLLVLGLLYPFAANLRLIVQEKEFRQKELMKIMSVSESAIELSWFISLYGFSFLSGCLTTLVSAFFYVKASAALLFIFWQLTFISIVTFSMFCSAFFTKTTRATLIGLIGFFAGYFLTLSANIESGNTSVIALVSLHPITALSYGLQIIGSLEDAGVGVVPSTLTFSEYQSGYSFLSAISSLIVSSLYFGFQSWYLNRVLPGQYGKAQPWNFLFTRSYWCPTSLEPPNLQEWTSNQMYDLLKIEPTSAALRQQELEGTGVHIRGLTKQFGDKTAVSELELSMYEGQVFALLGHNGAGKTSTINMLTGMTAPTSGYAIINGKSINTHMPEIRENLGICLQHDCLFDQLTVKEHLQFFARVKGLYSQGTFDDAEESIDSSIRDVALFEKRNTKSKDLSGGMKRKLSLAIAFCGDSKVVFLDEPTSGMDPFSRRFTWNVIRQKRQGRCIILTTHFMDEADLLGDRIGIMAEGQIRTVGSSLFLKKEFGVGYQITIEKKSDLASVDENVTDIIMNAVPDATILSDVSSELSFQLPLDASGQFVDMFGNLDMLVESKEIDSYGVSITTLEEVFLMVARGVAATGGHELLPSSFEESGKGNSTERGNQSYRSEEDISDTKVFTRHVQSLLAKRALNFKRDKRAWTCSTILPCLFSLLGFLSAILVSQFENMEPLELSLKNYNPSFEGESDRHPITFNEPESFPCQPGTCVSQFEGYSDYCRSLVNISDTCYQTDTGNIENILGSNNETFVIDEDVTSILEASKQLPLNSEKFDFGSSQYGALYFTHSTKSLINNVTNNFYGDKAMSMCKSSKLANGFNCSRFEGLGFVVSTNFTAPHASLLYQGLADEAIIKAAVGNDFSIKMKIHPLPYTYEEDQYTKAGDSFSAWFYLVLSFPFITGAFATFIVQERMSKAKHLQTVAGVKTSAYWLSSFLWDVCNYQFPLWIIVILMYAFGVDSFTTSDNSANAGTILLLFFFGPAAAGFTYITTFLFKSPSASNMFIIVFNFFVGFVGSLVVLILKIIYYATVANNETSNLKDIATIVEWVLRFIPSFNFAKGLLFIINVDLFARINEDPNMSVFSVDIMLYELIFLVWQSILYVLAAIFIDKLITNQKIKDCFGKKKSQPHSALPVEEIDDDIVTETERVISGFANDDLIVMGELKKEYRNGKVAVDGLSIGIPPGQCFGLLGINGAGKTTTLAMLTCEFAPTSGDATLNGYSIITQADETRRRIGYCPQFDAHFMNMTGREHIELYAHIKGIPKEFVHEAAVSKLAEVGLSEEDGDRISSGYSGGMKRKLSVACATIGDPRILILDEPSTGMDPVSRRDLWKVISAMIDRNKGTSAILTTHSMEECEALCPRIGIMAGGKLKCLGSAQHLKKRFGKGYQVEIKIKEASNSDSDFSEVLHKLVRHVGTLAERREREYNIENGIEFDNLYFDMDETLAGVNRVSGDSYLSEKISNDKMSTYFVRKSAESSLGISATELAAFCTTELRLRSLSLFLEQKYQDVILREREDTRMRFEVPSEGRKISSLFETIEGDKQNLFISEYGISQTTLEQVFNIHAEAAEKMKQGTDDG